MSASTTPSSVTANATPADVALPARMSTPKWLRIFQAAIVLLAALLVLVGETTLGRARGAMNTIAREATPSIVAAQDIRFALADLDANAANYLIGVGDGHRKDAGDAIELRRIHVADALVRAAENITYGDDERAPIKAMFLSFGVYLERVAESRLLRDRADLAGAKSAYLTATALMHRELFARADELDAVNKRHLDAAYDAQARANEGAEGLAVIVGSTLTVALVWAQVFLAGRTRRILNLPLLGGSVLTALFTLYLVGCFNDAREDLRVATKDAFDSVYALTHARAIAYDANGDESRFLLDPSLARGFDADFQRNLGLLSSRATQYPQVEAEIVRLKGGGKKGSFEGYVWDELANITFPGEADAAAAMIRALSRYALVDLTLRGLERSGKHEAAVELCIGSLPDESNAVFARFDEALQATLAINKNAFDATVERADRALKNAEWLDPAFAAAIALLGWLGIRPRLREYRA